MQPIFLTAEWRNLIMANYLIAPEALKPYVPNGVELDLWQGRCYISLVGFLFANTKVKGISIPFHRNFEEVNLRFYVKHHDGEQWKRGVVFIREIVPRHAITLVANTLYGEHYLTLPMRHTWRQQSGQLEVGYEWKIGGQWNCFSVLADPQAIPLVEGSEEQFITEHFWGYTGLKGGRTSEYQVEHPSWRVHPVQTYRIDCDAARLYGPAFAEAMAQEPFSVFLAEGSEVLVRGGRRLGAKAS